MIFAKFKAINVIQLKKVEFFYIVVWLATDTPMYLEIWKLIHALLVT